MPEANDQITMTEETVAAAKALVLANYSTAKVQSDAIQGTDANPLMAGLLAYSSLLLGVCREMKVHPMEALQLADALLSSKPTTSDVIH
jgi:hypothetical protein